MFVIGNEYTRTEIHNHVGGSKQSYLPTKDGVVVAACVTKALNPRAPKIILCGKGKHIASAATKLSQQCNFLPVFIKLAVNRWEYCGTFKVKESFTSGSEFDALVSGSGRIPSDVSRVIVLEETASAS